MNKARHRRATVYDHIKSRLKGLAIVAVGTVSVVGALYAIPMPAQAEVPASSCVVARP